MGKKVTIEARELTDVEVSKISIVKRGANRLPFRIIKENKEVNSMIDLSKLFFSKKEESPQPKIVALALEKGEYSDSILKSLEEIGFSGVAFDHTNDAVTLIKSEGDCDLNALTPIKMKNGAVAFISNIEKSIYIDSETEAGFMDAMVVNSVYPSINTAIYTLQDMIGAMLWESMSKAETTAALGVLLDDFKSYVMSVFNAVPEVMYKMEKLELTKQEEVQEQPQEPEQAVIESEANAQEQEAVDPEPQPTDEVAEPEVQPSEPAAEPEKVEVVKADQSLLDAIAALTEKIDTVLNTQADLTVRLEKAESEAANTQKIITQNLNMLPEDDGVKASKDVISKSEENVFKDAFIFDGFEVA
jgi:hypothetical protein